MGNKRVQIPDGSLIGQKESKELYDTTQTKEYDQPEDVGSVQPYS